jgi:phosphopantothenoylcysteine decarboxylase/phosphopantothenate--cysteine ligase
MRLLITAGPTHEPIDAVRYIANRSSGKMGAALTDAALRAGHEVTLILGPVTTTMPRNVRRIDVETAQQMQDAVLGEFPKHDLLIMAAAVADYRPVRFHAEKLGRQGKLTLELEATQDILAAVGLLKRSDQRAVGFSLESRGNLERAQRKLIEKRLDLIVYNPTDTMNSQNIEATLLWPDGRREELPSRSKREFADILVMRAVDLFGT